MTGRRYYITTLADWHRHAHRFANSHWLALSDDNSAIASRELADASGTVLDVSANANMGDDDANSSAHDTQPPGIAADHAQPSAAMRIVVLIDADEGVHLTLDDDAAFEALPHPFAPKQSRTQRTKRSQLMASRQVRPPSTPPKPSPAPTRSCARACFR